MSNIITNNQDDNIKSFHQAVRNNNYELVQELIKVVDINGLDKQKSPPLYYAILNHQWKMVQLLIQNGAKLNDDGKGEWDWDARRTVRNILHRAVEDLNVEESFIDFLLSQSTINIEQQESYHSGRTPILSAAEAGNLRILKYLITKYKPNIHVKCKNSQNLFHYAICSKDKCTIELIQYIHSLGVDINVSDRDHDKPLTYVIQYDLPFEIIQQLIECGAMFHINSDDKSTLPNLFSTINNDENDYELFKYVFSRAMKQFPIGDIKIKKILFEAVRKGNITISQYIVENYRSELNDDIIKTTTTRQNQSHSTNDQNDKENDLFIALGLNNVFSFPYPEKLEFLQSQKFRNILQLFEYLMENGIINGFFNFKTKYEGYSNYTLLLFLAAQPSTTLRLLQLCVENGADIYAVDRSRYNILHSFCFVKEGTTSEDLITKIDYFIGLGVNVNENGNQSVSTPLHFATNNRVHSSQLVSHLINKYHADINIRNYANSLAFHSIHSFETVKAFVSKTNVNFKYDDGNTHLLILLGLGANFDAAKYLIDDYRSKRPTIPLSDDDHYKSVIYLLDECGADVNVMNDNGDTSLHVILNPNRFERRPIEIIKRLIELQDPYYLDHRNYRQNNSSTPLQLAIDIYILSFSIRQQSKALQTIHLLLQHSANPIFFKQKNDKLQQQTILLYILDLLSSHLDEDDLESIIHSCIQNNHVIPQ